MKQFNRCFHRYFSIYKNHPINQLINTTKSSQTVSKQLSFIHCFKEHNLKWIDQLEITINNPSTVWKDSTFRPTIFVSTIYIRKENMNVRKQFYSDTFEDLIYQCNQFIENEIKV